MPKTTDPDHLVGVADRTHLGYADLCALYAPFVYGGVIDQWNNRVAPGAWRGDAWPCSGQSAPSPDPRRGGRIVVLCTCQCHQPDGEQHQLPPHSAPRTAVHPTEVRS